MYAVFVIAAILLSVAPGHARMLLSALPSSVPGHQVAPDDAAGRLHLATAVRTSARPATASYVTRTLVVAGAVPLVLQAVVLPLWVAGVLEHAPNAP